MARLIATYERNKARRKAREKLVVKPGTARYWIGKAQEETM